MTRLRTLLALSHILLAAGALILAGMLSTSALRGRFDQYVATSIDSRIASLARLVSSARYGDGTWNLSAVERYGITALEDGFLLTLIAHDGSILWDAKTHNAGLCATMVSSMADRMAGLGRDNSGSYSERILSLIPSPASHGLNDRYLVEEASLVVGYWGPVYYRDADLDFIKALNRGLLAASAIVIFLAAFAGIASAAKLADPVRSAASVARAVAAGDYTKRVRGSSIVELDELGSSLGYMAKNLADQNELRRRLVIDASHEIRTPLASLRARLEGLSDGVIPCDTATLTACIADIGRLTDLARSLEGLAETEIAACTPQCVAVDLVSLIKEVATSFADPAAAAGLEIELAIQDAILIKSDRILLLQVMENLVSNAVRYGKPTDQAEALSMPALATGFAPIQNPPRAKIRIELAVVDSVAVFSVRDWGSGIETPHLDRIFERFYRVDPSRSRATGGFGVGLAIARAAARACGGEVSGFSKGPGKGSLFEFRLPVTSSSQARSFILHRDVILG
jgi:signal transduction histidine kinase